MLEQKDIKYIEEHFYVYDQNWRMYQNYLGEPFLVENCLVYYDGRILYICAFPFEKDMCVNLFNVYNKFMNIIPNGTIEIIDIWGNCNTESFLLNNKNAVLFDYTPRNSLCFDSIVNINSFSLTDQKKARLSYNAFKNKCIQNRVVKLTTLSYQHIKLMEHFVKTHKLEGPHLTIFSSIANLIHDPKTYIVESYKDNIILGFAVLMKVSNNNAVYCLACYDNETRAADSTMYACIDFCKSNNIKFLHLGYSASESLLKFKQKWGGSKDGIEYEEYFISLVNDQSSLHLSNGKFLWRDRLFLNSSQINKGNKNEE